MTSRRFGCQTLRARHEVLGVSLNQMISTIEATWDALGEQGQDAMGEASIHHHSLVELMDGDWPAIEGSAPIYWCDLDCEDDQHAMDALVWATADERVCGYAFIALVGKETDLDLRVVFVTTSETESVMFKTGFG